ncbi:AraC family transcriptional regulator [Massilia sp. ML15P13]|uniref:AraC family transcriptional regulator n=2 Tax=Telluria aromaticivorans TaxID=2725995 RepID=A0A7Y2JXB6_9BURK|nr:AraC family transcriptional regulator [Telluria aromaticivorans]
MGTLSRLLSLYPVHTALDVRCHFAAPWVLDHEGSGSGIAPYHVVVRGRGWLEVGTRSDIPLQEGDIILFPTGAAHRLYTDDVKGPPAAYHQASAPASLPQLCNDGTGPVTDILCGQFEFGEEPLNPLLAALPELVHVRTVDRRDLSALRSLIDILRNEAEAARPGGLALLSQLASALFTLVMRAWVEQSQTAPGLFGMLAEPRLQPALHAMLTEPERPWELAELAALCNTSRATFARLFQRAAQATPAQVLTVTRMAKAATLLRGGRLPVGQIADQVGYQSEAAFNRIFKRTYGVGPGAYRRAAAASSPPRGLR